MMDQEPVPSAIARFGPNSARVEELLRRASQLTLDEAESLCQAQLLLLGSPAHHVAIEAVVAAAFSADRKDAMRAAELAGRTAIRVVPSPARAAMLGGIVGRMAEALVVIDLVPVDRLEPLLHAWRVTIGNVPGEGSGERPREESGRGSSAT